MKQAAQAADARARVREGERQVEEREAASEPLGRKRMVEKSPPPPQKNTLSPRRSGVRSPPL